MAALKSAKYERFAQGLADGKSQDDAYIEAGYSPKAARANASTLLKREKDISKRVAEILKQREEMQGKTTAAAAKALQIDKQWVLKELVDNVRMAKAADPVTDHEGKPIGEYKVNLAAANKALELIGKEFGMFIDRQEIRTGLLDNVPHDKLKQLKEALNELNGTGTTGTGRESRVTH